MQEYRRKKDSDEGLLKVYLNDYDDFIIIDANDSTFVDRYTNFIRDLEEMQKELEEKGKEYGEEYKENPMISEGENGDAVVDVEQLIKFNEVKTQILKRCVESIDSVFGENTIRKYFRMSYEINPDFVPNEDCIRDFMEEITPAIKMIYDIRGKKIKRKYSKSRKGKNSAAPEGNKGQLMGFDSINTIAQEDDVNE
jgi:hypothetical protein